MNTHKTELSMQNMVKQFQEVMGAPIGTFPQRLTHEQKLKRVSWMSEELVEYMKASTLEEEIDGLVDLIYFALGTAVEHGVELYPFFRIVQEANMSKVWEDGQARFNEQGKIIKPPNWVDPKPFLKEELRRQIELALTPPF